tara:strand:- start:372 stop:686 length:315 start_codon:yes stop_codon:yes gene_type:complete
MNDSIKKPFFLKSAISPMWKHNLRDRVRFLLASKGKSQNWLADQVGINHSTISKILSRDWIPTAKIKLLMAQHLEVDSLVLFGDLKYFEDYVLTIKKNPDKDEN